MLLSGQCATPIFSRANVLMSSGVSQHAVRGDDVVAEEADGVEVGGGGHAAVLLRDLLQLRSSSRRRG